MKKLLTIVAAIAIAIPFMAPRAEAQFTFIPYLGYDFDIGDGSLLVGVGAEFDLVPLGAVMLAVRPSAEYYFVDSPAGVDFSFFQINADALAELTGLGPGVGLYGGAGLALGFSSVSVGDVSDSATDFGINALAGIEIGTGFMVPFVQGRLTIMDGTRFGIQGGVKLQL
jgi:hypothetical protein